MKERMVLLEEPQNIDRAHVIIEESGQVEFAVR